MSLISLSKIHKHQKQFVTQNKFKKKHLFFCGLGCMSRLLENVFWENKSLEQEHSEGERKSNTKAHESRVKRFSHHVLTSTTTTITPANIKKKKNENTQFEKSMDNIQLVPTSRNIKAGTRTFGLQLIPTLKPILSAVCDNNKPCQNGNVWILCNPRPRSKFFIFC